MGYKTLGWYHSHPTFKSIPSQIDQETHLTHQIHYKDHHYIGVIIGPYEKPTSKKGEIFVFHVAGTQTYKLNFMIEPTQSLSQYDIEEIVWLFTYLILSIRKKSYTIIDNPKKL